MNRIFIILISSIGLFSCNEDQDRSDAYGSFEATELMVAAEANGKLLSFAVEEGQELTAGEIIGYIDTMQLHLKKQQLYASIQAILSKRRDVRTQNEVFEEQKKNLLREKTRLEKLLKDGAATPKQLDDLNGQLELVERQRIAQINTLSTANKGIAAEVAPIRAQITQIDDQIAKCQIRNPMAGRVLATYVHQHEITAFGRPLYKLADTKALILRVYAAANQLEEVQTGQSVEVLIDDGENAYTSLEGQISWISPKAEFTPRTIQTKEERVNLVYALKVKVENEGNIRIGMPGEVNFNQNDSQADAETM